MTTNRSVVRKQFAALLEQDLVGVGKPVKAVYSYQVGNFRGESPVVVVSSLGTGRGTPTVSSASEFHLEVHTFVLYVAKPVVASNSILAGTQAILLLSDTSVFDVGDTVTLEDDLYLDITVVTDVDPDVSITTGPVAYPFVTPRVYIWNEWQSEDLLDELENMIASIIKTANEEDVWLSIENEDASEADVVEIGGDAFRHELIPVKVTAWDV